MTQSEKVERILYDLKKHCKVSMAQVEKDLLIWPGFLWKVKDGRKTLNEKSFEDLMTYYKNTVPKEHHYELLFLKPFVEPKKKDIPINKDSVEILNHKTTSKVIKTPVQATVESSSKKPVLSPYMQARQKLKNKQS